MKACWPVSIKASEDCEPPPLPEEEIDGRMGRCLATMGEPKWTQVYSTAGNAKKRSTLLRPERGFKTF